MMAFEAVITQKLFQQQIKIYGNKGKQQTQPFITMKKFLRHWEHLGIAKYDLSKMLTLHADMVRLQLKFQISPPLSAPGYKLEDNTGRP